MGGILDRIQSPEDLKKLNLQEMEQLCKELRRFLLRAVSKAAATWHPIWVW
ncbi:MAG: 1-deoxy-D-xylulose-5-phosphate synthase N-terminal domain-containing protein [Anaerotignum sp.]